jgi:glycosyltransferase involved in cell wall biosynthesis
MESKRLKIAMIGHKDFPSREGGIEVVVEELAVRMANLGHEVTMYNRGLTKDEPRISSYMGVETRRVLAPKSGGCSALISSFTATLEAITRHYDVIHYHAEGPALSLFIPHMLGIKTVVTIHGLDWKRSKWGRFARTYIKLGEKIAAKYSDKMIVLSEDMQAYFKENYNRETVVIHNGITPIQEIKPDKIKTKWGLTEDSYILYLARITPEKGLHYLINAYNQIETDVKLVIAGRLVDDLYCREIREMALNNPNIIFTDFVCGDILSELYNNCRLYVLPSEIEGMPISLLEALSVGSRCLVSDIPENISIVNDYVYPFISKNEIDLRYKLELLINANRNLVKKKQVKDEICERYDWNIVTDKTLDVYQHVSGDRHNKEEQYILNETKGA